MIRTSALALGIALLAGPTSATTTGFLANPATNSTDWTNYVTSLGLGVNTAVNFETHPLGAINPTFYLGDYGLTLNITPTESAAVIDYTANPLGTVACPCSSGEGAIPHSRMIEYGDVIRFAVSFATPVQGFGFMLGDKYNPEGTDPTTLEAFTGANGTGTSLGLFTLPTASYQLGYQTFIGVASTAAEIGSVVLTDGYSGTGDSVFIDNFRITTAATATPEPASLALLATGLGALLLRRRVSSAR